MAGPEPSRPLVTLRWLGALAALFLVALIPRALLIWRLPTVYSYDAFTRYWNPSDLVVRHWLPLPQLPIFLAFHGGGSVAASRMIYAVVGALAGVATAWAVARSWNRGAGLAAGCITVFLPALFVHTIIPYQEGFLLLFTALTLSAWPDSSGANQKPPSTGSHPLLAMSGLALGCLSRYEAWILVLLLMAGATWRRQWRTALLAVPSLVVIGAWLLLMPHLSLEDGPPRTTESPIVVHLLDGPWTVLATRTIQAWFLVMRGAVDVLGTPLVVLAVIGLAASLFHQRGIWRLELPVFLLGVSLVAALRVVNAGVVTGRMVLAPTIWLVIFAGCGIGCLMVRLKRLNVVLAHAASSLVVAVLALTFLARAVADARAGHRAFYPEYAASRILLSAPPDTAIGILPRPSSDILGESLIGGIMAQSFELNPTDPRWSYLGKETPSRRPDLLVEWTGARYVVRQLGDPLADGSVVWPAEPNNEGGP